jgi:hypothetical protein
MGNSQSQSSENKNNAASPTSPSVTRPRHVGRRKSAILSNAKLPTAQLISGSQTTATQPTRAHAHGATVAQSPSHTRARSITAAGSASRNRLDDSAASQRSDSSIMGSESSKHQRPPSRTSTVPTPSHAPASHAPSPSPSTRPVDVPQISPNPEKDIRQFYPAAQPDSGSPYGLPPLTLVGRLDCRCLLKRCTRRAPRSSRRRILACLLVKLASMACPGGRAYLAPLQ